MCREDCAVKGAGVSQTTALQGTRLPAAAQLCPLVLHELPVPSLERLGLTRLPDSPCSPQFPPHTPLPFPELSCVSP